MNEVLCLGETVIDNLSGKTGKVIGRAEYLYQNTIYLVVFNGEKEKAEGDWIDAARLESEEN